MTDKDSLGSLFGKAKKWAREEMKNATRIGGDPNDHRRAREANEARMEQLERDAERAAGTAVVETLLPGVKSWREKMEAEQLRADDERAMKQRADREQRAGRATAQVGGGWVYGSLENLAVRTTADAERRTLFVEVESVDPQPIGPVSFLGFSFELSGYHGDGTYEFVEDDDFDAMQYALWLDREDDGWFFHPSYGAGDATVTDGVAHVNMVFGSSGSERIKLRAQVRLDG